MLKSQFNALLIAGLLFGKKRLSTEVKVMLLNMDSRLADSRTHKKMGGFFSHPAPLPEPMP